MATNLYYIEVTDTYAGEANYSWVTRHIIRAKSLRGAVQRFSRMSNMSWHRVDSYDDAKRYDSASGATCYLIQSYPGEDYMCNFKLETDERGC